jgi:signal transduction histidine kinase
MTSQPTGIDGLEFLQKRVDFLEEINRRFLYSIDVLKAFGELQRKIGTEHDIQVIQIQSARLFSDLIQFEACAFFLLQEDMLEFAIDYVEPSQLKTDLQLEIDKQIESGKFSWALSQLQVSLVPSLHLEPSRLLLLHPLATENRVMGMFVVVLNERTSHFSKEILTLISIVVISTSLAMENAILYQDLYQHNVNLDKLVKERTGEIRKFLGMAAHDMRNPLSAIRGLSDMMIDEETSEFSEDQMEMMKAIYNASNDMLYLVNDLLDISVIDSGELTLEMKPGDLIQLIKDTIRLDQITADRKGIKIESQFDPIPETLVFDHRKLKQVVDNLISNAIKFSPPDSTINVRILGANGDLGILVKDQGPGIPEDERDNVFKTFGKTSVRPTGGESSTGLGMAICNRIIIAHGGTISIDCPSEGGSEFLVSLNVGRLQEIAAKSYDLTSDT